MNKIVSATRVNHRYRGPAELDKHNLMIQQVNHDLIELYNKNGEKEYNNSSGQINEINVNIDRLISWKHLEAGEADTIYATLDSSAIIGTPISEKSYALIPINTVAATSTRQEIIGLRNKLVSIEEEIDNIYTNL
jgi:hypothetical protein